MERKTFVDSLRRPQTKEISFSAFSVEGCGEEPIKNWKGISLVWVRAVSEQRSVRNWQEPECVSGSTKPPRARRVAGQSLRDWSKKVRATVISSPQIETSCSERTEVSRAEGAATTQAGRKLRREATNWKGVAATQTEKALGSLSLVLNSKTI